MATQVVEVSQSASDIRVRGNWLHLGEHPSARVFLPDLRHLVLVHPGANLNRHAMTSLANHGVVVSFCDEKFVPVGMLLPLQAHHSATHRLRLQVDASTGQTNLVWQALVKAKLLNQAAVLHFAGRPSQYLINAASEVRSADSTNREAVGAQHYWKSLFGAGFRRHATPENINAALNYGYAVLRATVSRALVAAGFNLMLGVKHENKYNPLCLADDFMEPFRPVVDAAVVTLAASNSTFALGRPERRLLVEAVYGPVATKEGLVRCPERIRLLVGQYCRLLEAPKTTRPKFDLKFNFTGPS